MSACEPTTINGSDKWLESRYGYIHTYIYTQIFAKITHGNDYLHIQLHLETYIYIYSNTYLHTYICIWYFDTLDRAKFCRGDQ